MPTQKVRLSNIELLRILAMFFVLLAHAVTRIQGLPSILDINENTSATYGKLLVSSIAVAGVDIFVLISGWFGIRSSAIGVSKFIFQVLFLSWGIFLFFIATGYTTMNLQGIKWSMGLTDEYWFVTAYLGLYLLSPIMNKFVEYATKREFQLVLLAFYIYQCYYSWITSTVDYYGGYSITFFCGLYLTARYFRLYPLQYLYRHSLKIYVIVTFLISQITLSGIAWTGTAARMQRYDNPMVIIASLCLLLTFSKLKIQSRFINWCAISCFAVYIIHFNPLLFRYFVDADNWIFSHFTGIVLILQMALFLSVVFLMCVSIDKVRILCWNLLLTKFKS